MDAAAYFAAARQAFAAAAAAAPGPRLDLSLADRPLHLAFADGPLPALLGPAFRHRPPSPAGAPGLTVRCWHGTAHAPPPWPRGGGGPENLVRRSPDGRFVAVLSVVGGSLALLDAAGDEACYWVPDPAALPVWERSHPLDRILAHWHGRQGATMIHAGAVGTEEAGLLLVGRGGSGKSTSALACLDSPLSLVSDDYVMVAEEGGPGGRPVAHGVYGSVQIHAEHRARFPRLLPALDNAAAAGTEKPMMWLAERRPGAMRPSTKLAAIVVPRVVGNGPARWHPVSPAAALQALAPSSMLQLGTGGPATFARMAGWCRTLPCYGLEIGAGIDDLPERLGEILAAAASGRRAAQ
ncbi:MAG: hypothetical protein U1E53_28385 [Dongiaceae bacterium]